MNYHLKNMKLQNYDNFILNIFLMLFFVVSLVPLKFFGIAIRGLPLHYIIIGGVVFGLFISSWLMDKHITSLDRWLLFLIAGFSLSVITSVDRLYTVRTIGSFFLRGIGVAFIAERIFKKKAEKPVVIILIIVSLVSLIGLTETFFSWNPYLFIAPALRKGVSTLRPGMVSTIGHPLPFAAYLVLFFPLSLWLISEAKIWVRYIPLSLILLGVFLSFSRSSWISLFFVCFFYLLKKEIYIKLLKKWKIIIIFLLIIILPVIISGKIRNIIYARVSYKKLKAEVFESYRFHSYFTTLNILKKYPLFGVGMGNYVKVHDKYRPKGIRRRMETPDNMYLRFLCEIGLLGTFIFIVFIITWLYRLWKGHQDKLVYACFLGLIGFLINQVAIDLFWWLPLQFAFWMLLGMSVARLPQEMNRNN